MDSRKEDAYIAKAFFSLYSLSPREIVREREVILDNLCLHCVHIERGVRGMERDGDGEKGDGNIAKVFLRGYFYSLRGNLPERE